MPAEVGEDRALQNEAVAQREVAVVGDDTENPCRSSTVLHRGGRRGERGEEDERKEGVHAALNRSRGRDFRGASRLTPTRRLQGFSDSNCASLGKDAIAIAKARAAGTAVGTGDASNNQPTTPSSIEPSSSAKKTRVAAA